MGDRFAGWLRAWAVFTLVMGAGLSTFILSGAAQGWGRGFLASFPVALLAFLTARRSRHAGALALFALSLGVFMIVGPAQARDLLRKKVDEFDRYRLMTIRTALDDYRRAHGRYPDRLESLRMALPWARLIFLHEESSEVKHGLPSDDSGGWLYNNAPGQGFGSIFVNCTHTDRTGRVWSTY